MVLYGSKSWPLTKNDEHLLQMFEYKVLRTIFGGKMGVIGVDTILNWNETLRNQT